MAKIQIAELLYLPEEECSCCRGRCPVVQFHPSFTMFFLDSVFLVGCFFVVVVCLGVCFLFVCFWFCICYFLGRGRHHSKLCNWRHKKPQSKAWFQVCFQVQSKPRSVCTNHGLKTSVRVRKARAFLPVASGKGSRAALLLHFMGKNVQKPVPRALLSAEVFLLIFSSIDIFQEQVYQ